MRQMLVILFILSLGSTWAISFSLGHCIYIYTGSLFYSCMFQFASSFLSGLFVSQYIIEKFMRPIFSCEKY